MSLKDYIENTNQCIINNHSEFVKLLKWFLKHGAENCYGSDISMFDNIWDICDELDVKYEDWEYDGEDEDGGLLIKKVSELENFLLKNINTETLVPSEDEYPILVNWFRQENFDRMGSSNIKILNFTPMKDIKPMKNYLIEYTKKLKAENSKHRERCKWERERNEKS